MNKKLYFSSFVIAINCLVYFLHYFVFNTNKFSILFGLNSLCIYYGFYWQLVTSMFLHGSFMHLAMNMVVLYQFGSILERFLGGIKFMLIYLLGGIITNLLSLVYIWYNGYYKGIDINTIGASGAICVLLGFMAFIDKYNAKGLFIALILMSFAPLLMGINVAWYAHLLGFGIGYLSGKIVRKY
ncbi:rhomboid family intramembrane serine protease [Campylobacter sp. RM12327]|uniref:rhomboid family intramembrane serine protease n=1 Tax=Campylobacter sputorum TaxID=206 RepID=UPI000B798F4E|nr:MULTISPECIES: rhomboid family intramembrane serine protease [Campylobacter]ASM40269.1 rhomboid family protein [Campylobacter sputorum]MBE7357463.1 rhomboid family intramembrane serine protease [Campylobacter sp. RM11302]MBF6668773.1 rhomboid family intramembrane serine protease [Campylobacter sp. RM12327]MBF6674681.1 rhomboid family intramembrane serine protease [Campylobacter sp. RM13538]MBF6676002.1 rhomboid family intramembrane serine protease [Campylobacter sp. RM12321]